LAGKWVCECHDGFLGDCQTRSCPVGPAWFQEPILTDHAHDLLVECSNMGICDRSTGLCECRSGFEGNACERMTCSSSNSDLPCSGRGRCLSLRRLAAAHRNYEYSVSVAQPVSYGTQPGSALTWDADRIYGCSPDLYGYYEGTSNITSYTGAALDRRDCPLAFNHRLLNKLYSNGSGSPISNFTQVRAVQRITCRAREGFFRILFRGVASVQMSYNVTAEELGQALSAVTTVGSVSAENSAGSDAALCSPSDTRYTDVTFLAALGKLPLLSVTSSSLYGGMDVTIVQEGTDGLVECGGYGNCDSATGDCHCWPRQASSNGLGGQGQQGDCGFNLIF
jgi:hypothetical protein